MCMHLQPKRRSARFRRPPPRKVVAPTDGSVPLDVPLILRADCDGSLATIQAMIEAFPELRVEVDAGGGECTLSLSLSLSFFLSFFLSFSLSLCVCPL